MRKIIFFMVLSLIFVFGCPQNIPEELIPLLGYWNLIEYWERGDYENHFFFTTSIVVSINDVVYTTIYGSELEGEGKGMRVRLKHYGMLTDDFEDAKYSGNEYKYISLSIDEIADSNEWIGNFIRYFNFIDYNHIEGVYQTSSILSPYPSYGTFEGTRGIKLQNAP